MGPVCPEGAFPVVVPCTIGEAFLVPRGLWRHRVLVCRRDGWARHGTLSALPLRGGASVPRHGLEVGAPASPPAVLRGSGLSGSGRGSEGAGAGTHGAVGLTLLEMSARLLPAHRRTAPSWWERFVGCREVAAHGKGILPQPSTFGLADHVSAVRWCGEPLPRFP